MARLTGKRAVVLGCGGEANIGQAIARRFLAEGATVVVAGHRLPELATFADSIGVRHHVCDITSKPALLELATFAKRHSEGSISRFNRPVGAILRRSWRMIRPRSSGSSGSSFLDLFSSFRQ